MKLEVGMYVRTKKGIITKIEKCKNGTSDKLRTKETGIILDLEKWFKDDCVKSSPNIIDLIEVGDYVNGYYATTGNQNVGSIYIAEIDGLGLKKKLYNKDIKSIVTKEQFEQMAYKVGE